MTKNPTEHEPNIPAAIDLINHSAAAGLKAVLEDVRKLCNQDYAAIQTAMYLAYEEIAQHALANTIQSEDEFVRAARGTEKNLRERWRHHQAARAAATPAPEGFYKN